MWLALISSKEFPPPILNSDIAIVLPVTRNKNTVEYLNWIFLKTADQSHLVKIVLIMHIRYSLDIAHNSVNSSNNQQNVLEQISAFKQADGWPQSILLSYWILYVSFEMRNSPFFGRRFGLKSNRTKLNQWNHRGGPSI